jgi:hypothetical protein
MDYNEVIQKTSETETLANIVRVKKNEPTTFVQIPQISPEVGRRSSLLGGLTGIGLGLGPGRLAGATGSANLDLESRMSSTLQYQPLIGQAQVSQLITPITATSLTNLFDSEWSMASLLSLAVSTITPGYEDNAAAMNALVALDDRGVISLSVEMVSATRPAGGTENLVPVLGISFQRSRPLVRTDESEHLVEKEVNTMWCRFLLLEAAVTTCSRNIPKIIYFRMAETRLLANQKQANLFSLTTRSAFGILSAGVNLPLIQFVTPDEYHAIRDNAWTRNSRCSTFHTTFYTLTPEQAGETTVEHPEDREILSLIATNSSMEHAPDAIQCLVTSDTRSTMFDYSAVRRERRLWFLRRYLLIIHSPTLPKSTYASYWNGREWFYIDTQDSISQRNFSLIHQFLIIQAAAPTALLAPTTLSVGR